MSNTCISESVELDDRRVTNNQEMPGFPLSIPLNQLAEEDSRTKKRHFSNCTPTAGTGNWDLLKSLHEGWWRELQPLQPQVLDTEQFINSGITLRCRQVGARHVRGKFATDQDAGPRTRGAGATPIHESHWDRVTMEWQSDSVAKIGNEFAHELRLTWFLVVVWAVHGSSA